MVLTAPMAGRFGIGFIQERDDSLLVGNRDIDAAKRPGCQKGRQLIRGQLLKFIGVVGNFSVDFFGETVGKVFADAAVSNS